MILSSRVDELKGGARKDVALDLLAFLEHKLGPCKLEWQNLSILAFVPSKLPRVYIVTYSIMLTNFDR